MTAILIAVAAMFGLALGAGLAVIVVLAGIRHSIGRGLGW